jgi:hypothetical protein
MPVHVLGEPAATGHAAIAGTGEPAQILHRPDLLCRQGRDDCRFSDAQTMTHQAFRAILTRALAGGAVHSSTFRQVRQELACQRITLAACSLETQSQQ